MHRNGLELLGHVKRSILAWNDSQMEFEDDHFGLCVSAAFQGEILRAYKLYSLGPRKTALCIVGASQS